MRTVLVEASPFNPSTGDVVPIALAGGGSRAYRHRDRNDWRAGVVAEPKFSSRIQFSETGFSGGAIPEFGALAWRPAIEADLAEVAGLLWIGAEVTVLVGDDAETAPVWSTLIRGRVEGQAVTNGSLSLLIRDASSELDEPVAQGRFAGTGGLEGDVEVGERPKRRSWGRVSNVEALILKASTLVYEVGDPAFPLEAIVDVKDMGRSASSLALVAWAGTAEATLAALEAVTIAQGGGAVAPSIACVRWWTQPVGPLTVDLKGEIGTGYVETAAAIAERVVGAHSSLVLSNVTEAAGWRPGVAGLHVDQGGETGSQALDRLLRGSSLAWTVSAGGTITLRQITFANPVETVAAIEVNRSRTFRPLLRRRVGYRRNHREHSDAEISAALRYDDGTTIDELKPAEPGATEGAVIPTPGQPGGNIKDENGNPLPSGYVRNEVLEITPLGVFGFRPSPAEPLVPLSTISPRGIGSATREDVARAERSAERLAAAALRLAATASTTRENIRDAGIVVDAATGEVRISAVDKLDERTSEALVRVSAAESAITLRATESYVDQKVAEAVLDPSQVADLDAIYLRLSSAELEISANSSAITAKAELLELSAVEGRVTTAEQEISALEGAITTKVESASFTGLESRVSTAEQEISALSGGGSITQTITAVRLVNRVAEANAANTLAALLDADRERRTRVAEIASARTELTATIADGVASSTAILELSARIDDAEADLLSEQTTRATADSALASDVTVLRSRVGTNEAGLSVEQSTRANADSALASDITALSSRVGTAEAGLSTEKITRADADNALSSSITALSSRVGTAESAISNETSARTSADNSITSSVTALSSRVSTAESGLSTEKTTRANADSALASDITALSARVGTAESGLSTEKTTRADADSALSSEITTLKSRVGTAESGLSTEKTTRANADSALASDITNLSSRVGTAESAITTEQTTRANADSSLASDISTVSTKTNNNTASITTLTESVNGVKARYGVRLDVNGYVTGFVQNNDGASGNFQIVSDKFAIVAPAGGARTEYSAGNWRVYDAAGVLRVRMGVW